MQVCNYSDEAAPYTYTQFYNCKIIWVMKVYGLKTGGHVHTTPTEGGGGPVPDILYVHVCVSEREE